MKTRRIADGTQRTFAVVFDAGDEAMAGLKEFARQERITAAHFTAIGACRDITLAYFDWNTKDYHRIPVTEQVEVLVMAGDIAMHDGAPLVHAHAVVGRADGSTAGGHVLDAHVRPTLEVMLTETPATLQRTMDPESGLPLIDPAVKD